MRDSPAWMTKYIYVHVRLRSQCLVHYNCTACTCPQVHCRRIGVLPVLIVTDAQLALIIEAPAHEAAASHYRACVFPPSGNGGGSNACDCDVANQCACEESDETDEGVALKYIHKFIVLIFILCKDCTHPLSPYSNIHTYHCFTPHPFLHDFLKV